MEYLCETCKSVHSGTYASGRFCCAKCARSFSTKAKRQDINNKVSEKLTGKPNWSSFLSKEEHSKIGKRMSDHSKGDNWRNYLEKKKVISKASLDSWYAGDLIIQPGLQRIRKYLIERFGPACSKCGFSAQHPEDGRYIIEIDHINGEHKDNTPNNLRLLCPNCHVMTSTNSARNKKSNRKASIA